jgi:prepilin peptidase CpaA
VIAVLNVYPIPLAMILMAALIAGVTDIWKFKVYNLLTFPLVLSGLLYHAIDGGAPALAGSFLGALVGFALMIALYAMGGLGAGDVKFVTAIGAWLGLPLTLYVVMAGCIAAGVYALVLLVSAPSLKETLLNIQLLWIRLVCLGRHITSEDRVEAEVKRSDRRRRLIPFSAMMGIGLVVTLVWLQSQSGELIQKPRPDSPPSRAGAIAAVADSSKPQADSPPSRAGAVAHVADSSEPRPGSSPSKAGAVAGVADPPQTDERR